MPDAAARLFDPGPSVCGPKGARVGDRILAEGSWWQVEALEQGRAIARLERGAHTLRRFSARRIDQVAPHVPATSWATPEIATDAVTGAWIGR